MIFTECSCGVSIAIAWESGDTPGYHRTDCPCGKVVMVECSSFGETTVLDSEDELEEFISDKKLKQHRL